MRNRSSNEPRNDQKTPTDDDTSRPTENSAEPILGDVVVIGAGLGGLATALLLADDGHRVTVLERRPEPGGRAVTDKQSGFHFNRGAHALYTGGTAMKVLRQLGIKAKGQPPAINNGAVLRNGDLHAAPSNLMSLLRTPGLRPTEKMEMARLFTRLPKLKPAHFADQTVDDWLDTTLSTEGARLSADSLVRLTTYVNEPDQLSAEVAISQIQLGLNPGVLYLDHGWQQLVDQMLVRLQANPRVDIRYGERTNNLPDAPAVVIATGDPQSAARLLGAASSDDLFNLGPAARAACLDLGVSQPPDMSLLLGWGRPLYLSNFSAAADMAPSNRWHVATVGYLANGAVAGRSELEEFAAHGWSQHKLADITVEARYLHSMNTVSAIATAKHGGMAGRPLVNGSGHDNVFLVGDWVGPEGHLLDASMASAREAARLVSAQLTNRVSA